MFAALLLLISFRPPAVGVGAAPPQNGGAEAARRAFEEGERLRARGTEGALREAVGKYEEAARLRREARDRAGETAALVSLGLTFQLLRLNERAVETYALALALLRESGGRLEEADVLYNLGTAQLFLGRFEEAAASYERALTIQRASGDLSREGDTLAYLGAAYERAGRYGDAIDSFERALAIHRQARNRAQEGVVLNNLGAAYNALGRYDRALEHYRQALGVYGEVSDRVNEGTTLANAGYAYYKMGLAPKAVEFYERALKIQRELGDRHQEANTLTKLGLARLDEGRAAEALSTSLRAAAMQRELKDRYGEGRALDAAGRAARELGQTEESLARLGAALALMRAAGARDGEAATLGQLMLTSRARGAARLAVFYGKQSVNAYQELRRNLGGLEKRSQESFVGSKQETYRALAGLLIAEGRLAEARQVLDMLKQSEYLQFVRRGGETDAAAGGGAAALSPEEAALERRYREVSDRVVALGRQWGELAAKPRLTPDEGRRMSELEAQLADANAGFRKFLERLEAEFARSGAGAATAYQLREAEGLREVLRELGGGAVALYTVVGEKRLYVVLYTPDAMVARESVVTAAELNAKVFAFRQALQNPAADPRPAARELYRVLVGPVEKDLEQARAETLMWSLDGALRYVPVAALHDGERYMVERYRNVVFTPASKANLKDQPLAQSKGLGFGVSKAQGGFDALPSVPDELRAIFRAESADAAAPAVGGAAPEGVLPGRVLLDEAFTGESLRSSLRRRYPVVHIASHFAFVPGDETDSYLLLGDGGRLSLAQLGALPNLFGGVDLLTLSACDTATGGAGGDGKEVEGFAVIAQRQGAKSVVASLWPVADESTRLLMQEFYRLRGGAAAAAMSKAEAMRRAQLSLLRGGAVAGDDARRGLAVKRPGARAADRFSHPYFWAPFILIGNWK